MKDKGKPQEQYEPAKTYVDEQLAIMRKHGTAPKLSTKEYEVLVRKVAAATVK
jgi:hypothetical protein